MLFCSMVCRQGDSLSGYGKVQSTGEQKNKIPPAASAKGHGGYLSTLTISIVQSRFS